MRIGIVNDMSLAREALRRAVLNGTGHEVAWVADDGASAVEMSLRDQPDVILMDLIMPGMNGVEATRRIMSQSPCAILIVTATVSGNMSMVFEAMGNGALDAVDTPSFGALGRLGGADILLEKIAVVGRLLGKSEPAPTPRVPESETHDNDQLPRLVVLGASTGGPNALAEILDDLPRDWPACVVLIQHVDRAFAPGLAEWLARRTDRAVELAAAGDEPRAGRVLLAETDDHIVIDAHRRFDYTAEPSDVCYRPSIDVFFRSLAEHWPEPGVAALLTGMGRDGAEGLGRLRNLGWRTIAQDRETSVVWGMPREAVETGAAAEVLPLGAIGASIRDHVAAPAASRIMT